MKSDRELEILTFSSPKKWGEWLSLHQGKPEDVWLRLFRKDAGRKTISCHRLAAADGQDAGNPGETPERPPGNDEEAAKAALRRTGGSGSSGAVRACAGRRLL